MASIPVLVDQYLDALWQWNPVTATVDGVHIYDHLLADFRPESVTAQHTQAQELLQAFEAAPEAGLSTDDILDRRLAIAELATRVELHRLREWERNPTSYVSQAIDGVYYLSVRKVGPDNEWLSSIRQRLQAIPGLLATGRQNLTEDTPPIHAQIAIAMGAGGVEFFEEVVPQIAGGRTDVLEANRAAIHALNDFVQFLGDLASRCRGEFAIGRDLFDFLLQRDHLLDFNADSLAAWGEQMFARTVEQLEATARQIDPLRSWTEIVAEAKRDHPSADNLLTAYRDAMDRVRRFVADRELITLPPGEQLDVVDTPVFLRNIIPYAAYDPPPAFGPDIRGIFYVTPVDRAASAGIQEEQLQGHSHGTLPITALHEAYPGHHAQLARAKFVDSRLRRRGQSNVFAEGWALYCEEMMYESGFYESDLIRLFQLKDVLWRAGRVIVDAGLHAHGMSVQQAVDFMVDRCHLERPHAEAEVRRYTISPTQPMSYLVGKHLILEIRDRVRAQEGDRFTLRAFHDRLTSFGTVPPPLIRNRLVQ